MGLRGSKSSRTPLPVWGDGIHYVRRASDSDPHVMRWLVGAHRVTASKFTRHVETMDEGIITAKSATRNWLSRNPADRKHHAPKPLPASSDLDGTKKKRGRPAKAKAVVEPFSTYHFTCIAANPYAQVWQCTSYPGEKKPVGRKKSGGRAPEQTSFRHKKGQCSVLLGDQPVRNDDGTVRIFESWGAAYDHALTLYEEAPEDEIITWHEGDIVVWRTENFNVEFNPALNGIDKPFTLWNVTYSKPVYLDRTRPAVLADAYAARHIKSLQETNPAAYIEITEARAKARSTDRVPTFSEEPLKMRSITEAIKEAERREKMLRGETV